MNVSSEEDLRKDIAQLFNRSSNSNSMRRSETISDAMQLIKDYITKRDVYVIGEDEDLNAPLNQKIDGNPASDKYPLLYVIKRATRNVFRKDQRQHAKQYDSSTIDESQSSDRSQSTTPYESDMWPEKKK